MRFLSVADRELRCLARQRTTFRARWINGLLFFGLLVWLLWVFDGFKNQRVAASVFKTYSFLICLYCLFFGAVRTADSISSERREGTLGLLFLTNLGSGEIVLGKLCSTALASVYGFLAMFPMLALPLLLGGISFTQFALTVLGIVNAMFFALSTGFLVSTVCKRQFTAIAVGLAVTVGLGTAAMMAAALAQNFARTRPLANWLGIFSPFYPILTADRATFYGTGHYWWSVGTIAALGGVCLGLTILLLARSWRDRPQRVGWMEFLGRPLRGAASNPRVVKFRARLLEINPFYWLAGRQRITAPLMLLLVVGITLVTVYVAAPLFGRIISVGVGAPVFGHMFSWLWAGLIIHALVLYYAAMNASQRLAEDKQTGALELILSTPTTERDIATGLWLAYARKMFFPGLLAVLVHAHFCWVVMNMVVLDPPGGELPNGATPGRVFWSGLLNQPLLGQNLEWEYSCMVRGIVLALLLFMAFWVSLGWVARWMGLRMKNAGFAPIASLALMAVPPVLMFSLACFAADKLNLDRLPERKFVPMMMWTAATIAFGHCLVLSFWARSQLRSKLRLIALSRFQPMERWRFRLPSRRFVLRFGSITAGSAACLILAVVGYYTHQNWRGRKDWRAFQQRLSQRGETLAVMLPKSVPNEFNLAYSPAYLELLSRTNPPIKRLVQNLDQFDLKSTYPSGGFYLMDWARQEPVELSLFVTWNPQTAKRTAAANRANVANAVLNGLKPQEKTLNKLVSEANRCSAFQCWTGTGYRAVFNVPRDKLELVAKAQLVLEVRACARVATGDGENAAADLIASLRLARLVQESPDVHSTVRVQGMVIRALQPLWDGIAIKRWTGPQLSSVQQELSRFNLLANYTNTIERLVHAHIDAWQAIPDTQGRVTQSPSASGGFLSEPGWHLQPRAWWFENCIQLYDAGKKAAGRVDLENGKVEMRSNWGDVRGLPMDYTVQELLEQNTWWGANPSLLAFAQTSLNQGIIACALERYRFAHGKYPERLDELVPDFLSKVPHDSMSGRAMNYQLDASAGPVIRGVGIDGLDDRTSGNSDDWLWMYTTNKAVMKVKAPKKGKK